MMSIAVAGLFSGWADRVGWMLVHSIWEVGVVGVFYAVVLAALPRQASTARYVSGCVALLVMAISLPVTFAVLGPSAGVRQHAFDGPGNVLVSAHGQKLFIDDGARQGRASGEPDAADGAVLTARYLSWSP